MPRPIQWLAEDWAEVLPRLATSTTRDLLIICPFIRRAGLARVATAIRRPGVRTRVLTTFDDRYFVAGACELSALSWSLEAGADVRLRAWLHAKAFMFDRKHLVVTSANLTESALTRNVERGVLVEREPETESAFVDLESLFDSCPRRLVDADIQAAQQRHAEILANRASWEEDASTFQNLGAVQSPVAQPTEGMLGIDVLPTASRAQIDAAISSIDHSTFHQGSEPARFTRELDETGYTSISARTYVWLAGWCNTGGSYGGAMPQVQRLSKILFGYVIPNQVEAEGRILRLKENRYQDLHARPLGAVLIDRHRTRVEPLLLTAEARTVLSAIDEPMRTAVERVIAFLGGAGLKQRKVVYGDSPLGAIPFSPLGGKEPIFCWLRPRKTWLEVHLRVRPDRVPATTLDLRPAPGFPPTAEGRHHYEPELRSLDAIEEFIGVVREAIEKDWRPDHGWLTSRERRWPGG